jgi:hypothetical protein
VGRRGLARPPRDRGLPGRPQLHRRPIDRDAPVRAQRSLIEGTLERGELVDDETGDGLAWYRLSDRAYESYARVAAEQTALADWN